jgi:flavin-dependent dehydrogenase
VLQDLRDATENPSFEADVCVIGAGIAGLTVARRFLHRATRVVVRESGGLRYDEHVQELNDGASTGMRY